MAPADGDHAGVGVLAGGQGELQEALRPDEVDLERRAEGIAAVLGAADLAAGLADVGIVEGGQGGLSRTGQGVEQLLADGGKQRAGRDALAGVHAIVGGPIVLEAAGGAEQGGDGVGAEADDLSEQVAGEAKAHGGLQIGGGVVNQVVEGGQEEGGAFFLLGWGKQGSWGGGG